MSTLFFDTETTGFYDFKAPSTAAHQPHLVQLAMILDDVDGATLEEYDTIIRVGDVNIPASAAEVHGITTAMANHDGIPLEEAIDKFVEFHNQAQLLVAHNLNFDMKIMTSTFHRVGLGPRRKKLARYCTMEASTPVLKLPGRYNNYKWPKLDEAYRVLVDPDGFEGAHNALMDVRACREVYYKLRGMGL